LPELLWDFDPWIVVPLLVCGVLYATGIVRLWRRAGSGRGVGGIAALHFAAGWLFLWIALVSPLDAFGSRSLWGHMVQHELMMVLAAPLLVLGRPLEVWTWALPAAARRSVGRIARARLLRACWSRLLSPLVAGTLHGIAIWVWHAPALFQGALVDETMHTLQHSSFLAAGLVFWGAVFHRRRSRDTAGPAVLMLLGTLVHTGMLGALMTFSGRLWYPLYAERAYATGLAALDDQALAGLIMWVPGGVMYIATALALCADAIRKVGVDDAGARESGERA
jgi:putative membrane protein